jgi:hypothetical protein
MLDVEVIHDYYPGLIGAGNAQRGDPTLDPELLSILGLPQERQ